jgi:atypical dual specificity phosphatase
LSAGGFFLRKARATVRDKPTGFLWIEQSRVAASGCPASRRQLEWISRQGLDTVLSLTENPLPVKWVEGLALSLEHIPMKDHEPPSLESLDKAASFIQTNLQGGRRILVHCLAGKGRTMCVLAAYLIKEKGTRPEEAIRTLRKMKPGAVEVGQEKAILDYANAFRRGH